MCKLTSAYSKGGIAFFDKVKFITRQQTQKKTVIVYNRKTRIQ